MKITDVMFKGNVFEAEKSSPAKIPNKGSASFKEILDGADAKFSSVSVSNQKFKALYDAVPDVRPAKVQEFKQAVGSGTYEVDHAKLAKKILEDEILTHIL